MWMCFTNLSAIRVEQKVEKSPADEGELEVVLLKITTKNNFGFEYLPLISVNILKKVVKSGTEWSEFLLLFFYYLFSHFHHRIVVSYTGCARYTSILFSTRKHVCLSRPLIVIPFQLWRTRGREILSRTQNMSDFYSCNCSRISSNKPTNFSRFKCRFGYVFGRWK